MFSASFYPPNLPPGDYVPRRSITPRRSVSRTFRRTASHSSSDCSRTDIPRKLLSGQVNVRLTAHWMRLSSSIYNDIRYIDRFLEVIS
jgi:hypothetical protein